MRFPRWGLVLPVSHYFITSAVEQCLGCVLLNRDQTCRKWNRRHGVVSDMFTSSILFLSLLLQGFCCHQLSWAWILLIGMIAHIYCRPPIRTIGAWGNIIILRHSISITSQCLEKNTAAPVCATQTVCGCDTMSPIPFWNAFQCESQSKAAVCDIWPCSSLSFSFMALLSFHFILKPVLKMWHRK